MSTSGQPAIPSSRKRDPVRPRTSRKTVASVDNQAFDNHSDSSSAALAQRLGSENSWAERFVPGSNIEDEMEGHTSQYGSDIRTASNQEIDLDPPPAYSPPIQRANIHELPAEPILAQNTQHSPQRTRVFSQEAPDQQNMTGSLEDNTTEPDVNSSLLGTSRRTSRGCWRNHDKHRKRGYKFFRLLVSTMMMILIFFVIGTYIHNQRNSGDVLEGQPTPTPSFPPLPNPSDATPEREYRRHETFGSISGTIPLYDLIDISTLTGSIDVTIDPQPGDNPGVLRISSTTGYIKLNLPSEFLQSRKDHSVIERQFQTSINNTVGGISGSVLVGNGGLLEITAFGAGSISMSILATGVSPFDPVTSIATMTNVGLHNIKVESLHDAYPVTNIRAKHIASGSSSLELQYPPEWIGKVSATAGGTGRVKVTGDHLNMVKSSIHKVVAYKGSSSKANLVEAAAGGTGSVYFNC